MPKVVVDTNVFVSGLLKTSVTCRRIIHKLSKKEFILIVSHEILEELIEVIGRPKFHHIIMRETAEKLIKAIRAKAILVKPSKKLNLVKNDPDDDRFLEAALEGKADFLVTGDKNLLSLRTFHTTDIVSPAEFIKLIKS